MYGSNKDSGCSLYNKSFLNDLETHRIEYKNLNSNEIQIIYDDGMDATVDVSSKTKGKGFQGVVKRWNFSGGPASHGSMFHRRGGSYGLCQWPGRVFKNKKMPGHMGDAKRTTQNLKVVKVIPEKNILLVKGSVPGHKGAILTVRVAKKSSQTVANGS